MRPSSTEQAINKQFKIREDNYVRGLEKSASPERKMARLGAHAVSSDYAVPITLSTSNFGYFS